MKKTAAMLCAMVALGLAACSAESDTPESSDKVEESAQSSAPADTTRGDPSVGDRALQVGQTRHGENVDTTVVKIEDNYTEGAAGQQSILDDEHGDKWFAVFVRYCITKTAASGEALGVMPQNITVGTASGATYSTPASYDENFPSPRLPDVSFTSGCKEGWVNFALKNDVTIDRVFATDFMSSDEAFAEWRLQ